MPSPLLPHFEKRIADSANGLLRAQVDPWLFMGNGLSVKRFDGRQISYSGIPFEGSPRQVFWSGYIQPFIEHLTVTELSAGSAAARERDVDGRELLPEIQGSLLSATAKIFARMADVDRRLRGNGYPESVPLRNTESDYNLMAEFINRHTRAELQMWRSKSSLQHWYDENRFWVWLAGTVLAIVGLVVPFL